jgi:hypothetical protein
MEKLSRLKKGDKIIIEYGHQIHKATVTANFPQSRRIYLSISIGCGV